MQEIIKFTKPKHEMKKIYFIILATLYSQFIFAQISIERQVIGSSGNLTNTGVIQGSSNVGDAIIPTFSQSTLIVTQGFQQPDTINNNTGILLAEVYDLNILAYPNPTMNDIILDFSGTQTIEIAIEIYNSSGQIMCNPLKTSVQNNCKQELSFAEYATGNYFICVKSFNGKLYHSFKVQKIN